MATMWDALVDLACMLHRGEVDIDDLGAELKKRKSEEAAGKPADVIPNPVAAVKKPTKLVIKFNKSGAVKPQPICFVNYTKKKRSRPVDDGDDQTNKRRRVIRVLDFGGKSKTELFLTQEIRKRILDFGGREESVAFVIEKKLYKSDVDPIQNRFSIPHGKVNGEFLNRLLPTEVARLETGVPVTLFGFDGEKHTLCLTEWKSNGLYVLVGGWKDICRRYELQQHQLLQLWFFRTNDQGLSFALLRVPPPTSSLIQLQTT